MNFKEIRVSPKIRVAPSGTLSQSLDLENLAMACHQSACAICSDSGQSAVDSSAPGGNRLASVVSAAYSIGLRPLADCRTGSNAALCIGWSILSRVSILVLQASLPCNMLLCTLLRYSLPLIISDTSLLVSNGTNCLNLFYPIRILASTAASASPSTRNMLPK